MMVLGSREPMRNSLQELLTQIMPPEDIWLVNWILGRWPRGKILAGIPVSMGAHETTLGIVAPLMPTRIAVSQGPLPFDIATVTHFKQLHAIIDEPGLLGCRLGLEDERVTKLSGRWKLRPERLPEVFEHWGLADAQDMGMAILEGLSESCVPGSFATVEATYTPTPAQNITLELGPVGLRETLQLISHVLGVEMARSLAGAAKCLRQKVALRTVVTIGSGGVESMSLLISDGQTPKGQW